MNLVNNDRMTRIISVVLSVMFGVLFISLVADAVTSLSATTITLENGETITNDTDGTIQLLGVSSTTSVTLLNGETITNATDGVVQITATTLKLVGTASTSALIVGDEPAAPTIEGLVHGYCSFGNITVTASTTAYFTCTATPAGSLVENDRVFVQATGTLDTGFIFEAASTTGVSSIQIRVRNISGELAAPDGTMGAASINFWAVR